MLSKRQQIFFLQQRALILNLPFPFNLQQQHSSIDKMPIEVCPTVHPTMQEFSNFYEFTHYLDRTYKNHFGMVKVVPPQGWKGTIPNYQAALDNLHVTHPIEQNVQGKGGYFEARNIVQPKMTFKAYRKYAEGQDAPVMSKSAEQKERLFWKTVMYSPPIYGADLTGTLMGEEAGEWNMNSLSSLLEYAMPYRVRGVTEPYCYIGTWKAFFSWHKEDLDLSAINYIHEGQSKVWYSIAVEDGHILQAAAKKHYPTQYLQCKEFLRHKTFLINPEVLLKEYPTLRISKAVHSAGEMMLVFGGAYHEGFNCGFNIAEAVNYATLDWLKQLLITRSCACSRKSVKTQIQSILYNLEESEMFEQLLATQEFMQLRAYVQRQQEEEEARKKQEQQECKQLEEKQYNLEQGVCLPQDIEVGNQKPSKSKPIHKKKAKSSKTKSKISQSRSICDDIGEEEVIKCITEVEQTKKSYTNDNL